MKKLILFSVVCLSMVLCGCEGEDVSLKGQMYRHSFSIFEKYKTITCSTYLSFKSNRKVFILIQKELLMSISLLKKKSRFMEKMELRYIMK